MVPGTNLQTQLERGMGSIHFLASLANCKKKKQKTCWTMTEEAFEHDCGVHHRSMHQAWHSAIELGPSAYSINDILWLEWSVLP